MSISMLTNGFLKPERLDELKTKQNKTKKTWYSQEDSSGVEDIARNISLKRMSVVLTLVFPSVEECQVQKPCIRDELRSFLSLNAFVLKCNIRDIPYSSTFCSVIGLFLMLDLTTVKRVDILSGFRVICELKKKY